MLRRFAPRLSPFTSGGGGSALHIRGCPPAGVYLPWTARPWEVTHRVHHSQWKFLDTVFAHLVTVTPEELNTRAREQGVRDVLCDLEEPAMALRRQQTRQAWRQRQRAKAKAKAKAAKLEAAGVVASVTPAQASKKVPMARSLGEADSLSSHLSTSPSTRSATRGESQAGSSWPPSTTATEKAVQEKDEEEKSGGRWLKRSASSTKPAPTSSSLIKSSASALVPAAHTQDAAEVKQDNAAIDTRRTEASSSSNNAGKKSKKSRKPRKSRLEDNSIVSAYFL